jgi:hypothetical protein
MHAAQGIYRASLRYMAHTVAIGLEVDDLCCSSALQAAHMRPKCTLIISSAWCNYNARSGFFIC